MGFYLLPRLVKTYAPRGQTPGVDEWPTRDHRSVMGGVTTCGTGYSLLRPTSLNGWPRIAFLIPLGRLVIGAGWPIHRRAEVQEFVAAAGGKVQRGPLPASAPDRHPGEWL